MSKDSKKVITLRLLPHEYLTIRKAAAGQLCSMNAWLQQFAVRAAEGQLAEMRSISATSATEGEVAA